jgi:hypothetical protein
MPLPASVSLEMTLLLRWKICGIRLSSPSARILQRRYFHYAGFENTVN